MTLGLGMGYCLSFFDVEMARLFLKPTTTLNTSHLPPICFVAGRWACRAANGTISYCHHAMRQALTRDGVSDAPDNTSVQQYMLPLDFPTIFTPSALSFLPTHWNLICRSIVESRDLST